VSMYSLIHFVYLPLPYGFTFFGSLEIHLHRLDPQGWWVENVFNKGERLPDNWSKLIKEAVDADKKLSAEITAKCVREIERLDRRAQRPGRFGL
jgi:hypothetical protein